MKQIFSKLVLVTTDAKKTYELLEFCTQKKDSTPMSPSLATTEHQPKEKEASKKVEQQKKKIKHGDSNLPALNPPVLNSPTPKESYEENYAPKKSLLSKDMTRVKTVNKSTWKRHSIFRAIITCGGRLYKMVNAER